MEVNKKQLADIFGASIRTIQNWQEQGMPVLRGGGKGNEVLYDSAAVINGMPKGMLKLRTKSCAGRLKNCGRPARQISSQGLLSTNAIDLRVRRPTHRS